jgi:DNA-binding NarL/FixJ family response regulator
MADVKLSASGGLHEPVFAPVRPVFHLDSAEGGAETADGHVEAKLPPAARQNQARPFALVDSYALSHDCIRDSLSQLRGRPAIASFVSIDDCLLSKGADFSLIIVYLHGLQTQLLQDLPRLRKAFETSSIFLITDLDHDTHPQLLNAAIQAGARGFVSTRTAGISLVLSAIDFVLAGGFFAPLDAFIRVGPASPRRDASASPRSPLTARETIVMDLLREGKSNKTIARELALSCNTVKVHIRNILLKMSMASRLEAMEKPPSA